MPVPLTLILAAIALIGLSGVPGLWLDRSRTQGQWLAVGMAIAGAIAGLVGAGIVLAGGPPGFAALPGSDTVQTYAVGVDCLGAFFLVPVFLVGGLGSIYGLGYWPQARHPSNGRKLRFFWGMSVAGMGILILARQAFVFLLGWEIMAVGAFFLVSTEEQRAENRAAGWLYLAAAHAGVLALFGMFALLHSATGSYALRPVTPQEAGVGLRWAIFLLALVGFGLKAGVMPLHFWLPSAHANAPSHVSALMSGVMIKMGIYGLVRITGLLPAPPLGWGALVLLAGAVSGVAGVLFAIGQHDLKRLLAYHSVENIGIIMIGFGLALAGRALDRPAWVVLGLGGALLHVWNHCLFKGLLFLGAGAVVHATHTRQIDRLGGMAATMPWTAAMFGIGAAAICGLPPLNGFVSELLIYLGLLNSAQYPAGASWVAAVAIPVLALIGALALACFVKVFGAVFLGQARLGKAEHARRAPLTMAVPMGILAALCGIIGLAPVMIAPLLDRAVAGWIADGGQTTLRIADSAPLAAVGYAGLALAALALVLWGMLRWRLAAGDTATAGTWGCGYLNPTPRMQYTASSFAAILVGMFGGILRPHCRLPDRPGAFPPPSSFSTHVGDVVLDRFILPGADSVRHVFGRWRRIQGGLTQHYLFYIFLTVIILLALTVPWGTLLGHLYKQ